MEVLENKRIKEGTIIKWQLPILKMLEKEDFLNNYNKVKSVELVCIKNYSHHSDFQMLEPPYSIINIQNSQLYMKGIYKAEDFIHPFARF